MGSLLGSIGWVFNGWISITYDWAILNINWPWKLFELLAQLFDIKRMKTEPNKFFVSTTDGATGVGIATVSILVKLDKEHCIRGHFSARIIFTLVMVFIF